MCAQTNMDQIRLYTREIPSTMEKVKHILESKNEKLIGKILPIQLEQIQNATTQSATLSLQVVDSFDLVMNLTDEVLSAVTATKGLKEQQLDDTRKEQEVLKVVVTNTATMLEEMKKDKEHLEKTVEKAQNDVYEAMRNMPSGWNLAGMNAIEGAVDALTCSVYSVSRDLQRTLISAFRARYIDIPEKVNLDQDCLLKDSENVLKIVTIAKELAEFAARDFKDMDSSIKSEYSAATYISMLETIAEKALDGEMVKICQAGIEVMKTLEGRLSSGSFDDTKEVRRKIQDFFKQATELEKTGKSKSNPVSGRTPSKSNDLPMYGRASDIATASAKLKVEIMQENFKVAQENAEKARVRMEENNRKNLQAQAQLKRMKFSKMSYGEAIKLLQDGLANLSKLKAHWFGLVRFFTDVSNLVKATMNIKLSEVSRSIRDTCSDVDVLTHQVNLQIIYCSAIQASRASSFIHGMADMYTKVSAKYIMPNIAKLDQLIAFDPETEGMSIDQKREELQQSFIRVSNEIHTLIVDEKNALLIRMKDQLKIANDQYASMQTNSGI